jgi:hypothetical protein
VKITIEPTENQSERPFLSQYHAVSIQSKHDDLDIHEVAELLNAVLQAWGFGFADLMQNTEIESE